MGNDIGRIARYEQDLDVRQEGEQPCGQVSALHPGHHSIGNEQMGLPGVFFGKADRFTRGQRSQHRVA